MNVDVKPPRKPSKANLIKYDTENSIARRVKLMRMFDTEFAILGKRKEEAAEAHAALKERYVCYNSVPSDPEEAKRFLETCEELVDKPATNTTEHIMKAGAAFSLMTHFTRVVQRDLPPHVERYIVHHVMLQMKALMLQPLMPYRVRNGEGPQTLVVDETMADLLVYDTLALEAKTFVVPGSDPEDTRTFRVIGSGRSNQALFWEVLFEDAEEAFRMDQDALRELLFDTIMCDIPR
ncbi:hypothetical protein SCHPADRAFT_927384 [Schizopora paradoxa]|uniref:Uncharacterized protein n=1 Tax=Schizopora paradoxa TaxID=27342 RepID=A0A0H2RTF2_9AGAM|nr:hypothetical protein SCHPADRAFT_927384 [Schizopora paradoxa]